jgi:hypothetical protein
VRSRTKWIETAATAPATAERLRPISWIEMATLPTPTASDWIEIEGGAQRGQISIDLDWLSGLKFDIRLHRSTE